MLSIPRGEGWMEGGREGGWCHVSYRRRRLLLLLLLPHQLLWSGEREEREGEGRGGEGRGGEEKEKEKKKKKKRETEQKGRGRMAIARDDGMARPEMLTTATCHLCTTCRVWTDLTALLTLITFSPLLSLFYYFIPTGTWTEGWGRRQARGLTSTSSLHS